MSHVSSTGSSDEVFELHRKCKRKDTLAFSESALNQEMIALFAEFLASRSHSLSKSCHSLSQLGISAAARVLPRLHFYHECPPSRRVSHDGHNHLFIQLGDLISFVTPWPAQLACSVSVGWPGHYCCSPASLSCGCPFSPDRLAHTCTPVTPACFRPSILAWTSHLAQ